MATKLPRYIVWSTDKLDLSDSFQKRWFLRQTLIYGRAEDIRGLEFEEIMQRLDSLDLPKEIDSLWRRYMECSYAGTAPR
jgi:hypothetical protein